MKNFFTRFTLSNYKSPSYLIKNSWGKFKGVPNGNVIFSKIVGQFIPYTGSISPLVETIEDGYAKVFLRDRKAIRNHLDSIHAIALANVGEFTTGLSVISQLSETAKAILVRIEVEYLKKARGDLISEASSKIPTDITQDTEFKVEANIKNLQNEVVCKVTATWRVRP
jgi:acyl-coenzyme A thioesterase PaaI-like protein